MAKHKDKYTDEPIGKIEIVDDFLPKPKNLVLKEEIQICTHKTGVPSLFAGPVLDEAANAAIAYSHRRKPVAI